MNLQSQIIHALRAASVDAIPSVSGDVFCSDYGWLFIDPISIWKHALMEKALRDGHRVASCGSVLEALMVVSNWQIGDNNRKLKRRGRHANGG